MCPITFIMYCFFFRCIIYHHLLSICTCILYFLCLSNFLSLWSWTLGTFSGCLGQTVLLFLPVCFRSFSLYCVSFYFGTLKWRGTAHRPRLNNPSKTIKWSSLSKSRDTDYLFSSKIYSLPLFSLLSNHIVSHLSSANYFQAARSPLSLSAYLSAIHKFSTNP